MPICTWVLVSWDALTWDKVLKGVLHPGAAEGREGQRRDLPGGNALADQYVQLSNLRVRMEGHIAYKVPRSLSAAPCHKLELAFTDNRAGSCSFQALDFMSLGFA